MLTVGRAFGANPVYDIDAHKAHLRNLHALDIDMKIVKGDVGKKFDDDKTRLELLSVPAEEAVARVLTFGAKKYGDRNWENGLKYSRLYGAAKRHINAWWNGEKFDPETGENHLAHAACCVQMLLHYEETGTFTAFDDKPRGDK
jgi:hypothetical protein